MTSLDNSILVHPQKTKSQKTVEDTSKLVTYLSSSKNEINPQKALELLRASDINIEDPRFAHPLFCLLHAHHKLKEQLPQEELLDLIHQVDFTNRFVRRKTILMMVLEYNHSLKISGENLVKIIQKSNINSQDNNGQDALYYACNYDSFEHIKLLVEHGAKIDQKYNFGESPLLLVYRNHPKHVFDMLDLGANPDFYQRSLQHVNNPPEEVVNLSNIVRSWEEKQYLKKTSHTSKIKTL